jgi:hypothetical protein
MDRSVKAFIVASLVWLVLGALFGTLLSFGPGANYLSFRFAHMHLLLLGFMAMMVYGVGYFILPRFNGTTLRWPRLVPLHFWIANGGLVGLVFADIAYRPLFASVSFAGMLLFAVHLIVTLLGAPAIEARLAGKSAAMATAPQPSPREEPRRSGDPAAGSIRGDETIGGLLAAHPQLEDTIRLFFGDGCFSCPGQSSETLEQAALVHNIEPELLLAELRKRL